MAEAILKHLVSERPDAGDWRIASAGTWARDGAPPAVLSQVVVQDMGLDITAHRSQPVLRSGAPARTAPYRAAGAERHLLIAAAIPDRTKAWTNATRPRTV